MRMKVLDVPASIQAISGDALQSAGAAGIMSIAGEVPGLSIQDLGPGDKKYVIRGINSTGDATAGIYYGEAVISGSNADDGGGFQSDIRLYDLDHIEVLRGPQGTLYGASSMSGTIRFVPKTPDLNTLGGYLTMEGSETTHASGNYNINGARQSADHRRRAWRCAWWDGNSTTAVTSTRLAWARASPALANIGTAEGTELSDLCRWQGRRIRQGRQR